ncbi:MAG TPA: prephenate dehydrogenase/arogenate dehydrogenase family protein [Planctomycetota bacterium]|nr:prephenate dehydrogenase/arogenate dehydrogenase family protein [Planctomycetota bacterium]
MNAPYPSGTVAIAGLGLIGGSLGLALRAAGVRVVATDPAVAAEDAIARGACDALLGGLAGVLAEEPDLLVLAASVERNLDILRDLVRDGVPRPLVVTDVGSVKGPICALGRAIAEHPELPIRFVGGHPLAGAEKAGLAAARADLFRGAPWVLCPAAAGDAISNACFKQAFENVAAAVRLTGARPIEMTPERHDRIVAVTSHLPHLLASALAAELGRRAAGDPAYLELAGRGFRDMTRIADGPTDVWQAIFRANEAEVRRALEEMLSLIAGEKLPALLDAGREARAKLKETTGT